MVLSGRHANGFCRQFVSGSDIAIADDMKCVSFMARATLYFSMINDFKEYWMIRNLHEVAGIVQERYAFHLFTNSLLEFVKETSSKGKMIWISPINQPFVDIQSIRLMQVDPVYAEPVTKDNIFIYQGSECGFKTEQTICQPSCHVSSEFTLNLLEFTRECRSILQQLRLRGASIGARR